MPDIGDEFSWLKGVTDWYNDSSFKQWGEDLQQDVVNPALRGAYRTLTGDLTSGANEIKGAAELAAGIPDALLKGAETSAIVPYAAARGGLPGAVNVIDNIWGKPGPVGQVAGMLPGDSSQFNQAASTLFRPIAEAPGAAGEAVFQATGSPLAATVAETGTAAAEMIFPTKNVRNIVIPGTGKNLKLYGADPKLANPVQKPVNPMDPAGRQRGSVKVVDPDADTIKGMFADPRRVIPAKISTKPATGPQGSLFPEAPLIKSVIPEAIDRIANKFGEKPIPAKRLADEIQRMGIKPDELDMYGLTPLLSYGIEEGHEIAPEDLRDAVANKNNELQILTGGEGVNYGPETPESTLEIDDPEQYAINQNLHRSSSSSYKDRYGDDKQSPLFNDKDDQGVAQAADDFMTFNLIDPDDAIHGTGVSGFIRQIQRMPALKPDDMSREEFIVEAGKVFDHQAEKFIGDDYREKMRDPQYGQMERAWDERKQNFLDSLDRNLYWREQAAGRTPGDNYNEPDIDPSIHTARGLESGGYQTDFKAPGSVENSITMFNFPKSSYGGRDSNQHHFPPPKDYTTMGHGRDSRRLALADDFPYETLSDVPPGTEIPTIAFKDERQFDAHRTAQNPQWDQYNYARDLFPQEENRMFQLRSELDGLRSEAEQYDFYTPERDAADKKIDAVSDEIDKLVGISQGATPDYPYKGRIAQTKLSLKQQMINAALRGDEFAGISTPRMVALSQGSGEGMTYVEDVGWNPDSETWDVGGFGAAHVPTVEMKRFFSDEELAQAKASIMSKEDYKRDYLTFLVEEPDMARSVIEGRDGTNLEEGVGFTIPEYYYSDPKVAAKLEELDAGRGMVLDEDNVEAVGTYLEYIKQVESVVGFAANVRTTAQDVIWDNKGDDEYKEFVAELGGEYDDLDDYVMQEAEKYVRDDDPDDRMNTMTPNQLDTYIDDYLYDEYLNENDAAKLSINDEVILDESIAGSAANYNDNITIPAIQQIYDEMGLGEYKPTYMATPITDSPTDSVDDYDTVERVPVIPMTPEVVSKTLSGEMTLFGPLNKPKKTREERIAARAMKPTSLFNEKNVADIAPFEVGKSDLGQPLLRGAEPQLFTELPSDRIRGLPETVYVPGKGEKKYGNFQPALDLAKKYTESTGRGYAPPRVYAPLDEARGKRLADEYERMPDIKQETDPKKAQLTIDAYQAMADETLAQYQMILDETGLEVDFNYNYDQTRDMIDDVINNNHMSIFPTEQGFGVDTGFDPSDNPLLAPTKFTTSDGQPMLVNDVFRAVHDYFGHVKNGVGFRPRGEEAAWQSHASMYSPLARRAMTTETRGQNSWVNFGPYAEQNRTASPENTQYADQKVGLLPVWASEEGRLSATDRRERFRILRQNDSTGFEGAVGDDGKLNVIHYSREPISRTDPSKWGKGLSRKVWSERARGPDAPDRTFFGIESSDENPYRKERGLGSYRNEASVDPELIYDVGADPEGLWQRAGFADDQLKVITDNENRLRDAGYMGYYRNHPQLGKVVAVFDELEVKPYE